MTSTPITSTYAPSAFFPPRRSHRAPRLRRRSSSSSSGTASSSYLSTGSFSTSEDDEDDDDSSDLDEESTDSDGSLSGGGLGRTSGLIRSIRGAGQGTSIRSTLSSTSGPAHSHLKLSLSFLRVRQSLSSPSPSFDSLTTSLKSLSAFLPTSSSDLASLGIFIPILERLSRDLEDMLGEEEKGSKEWRRGLKKEAARALVGLRQRWLGMGEGKGKGKAKDGGELEWVGAVRELVAANPPPSFLRPPSALQAATASFLTSLESLLLPSSLPRLSLSTLNLTSADVSRLDVLSRAEEALEWYLSFHPSDQEPTTTARSILLSVRSLDLSKNQLTTLPPTVPLLLPGLETLSLSQNAFHLLPASLPFFSHLRRLKLNGNQLARWGRTKLPRQRGLEGEEEWLEAAGVEQRGAVRSNTREVGQVVRARMRKWNEVGAREDGVEAEQPGEEKEEGRQVPTLLEVSLQVVKMALSEEETGGELLESIPTPASTSAESLASSSPPAPSAFLFDDLPSHLHYALTSSYTCASCHAFISPLSTLGLPIPPSSSPSLPAPEPKPISLHLPPLYERLHFLSPGVNLPTQIRPPPSPPSSSPSHPSAHHLTTEERVLLALYGRGTELTTLVVGDEVHHRFCTRCAVGHLGLLDEEGEGLEGERERLGRECGCAGCEEERRVKGEPLLSLEGEQEQGEEGERLMRWLRRRTRRLSTMKSRI